MNILMVSSEAAPFIRTGDVANVVTDLAVELRRQGHDVRIVIPRYRAVECAGGASTVIEKLEVPLGVYSRPARLLKSTHTFDMTDTLPVYLLEDDYYFGRQDTYGYLDDYERFTFYSRAVLEMLRHDGFRTENWFPEVIHGHDWIAGLIPMWLRHQYREEPSLHSVGFAYTLHNAGFTGRFGYRSLIVSELTELGAYRQIQESAHAIDFMGRGVLFADRVNTVSPRHAEEIMSGAYAATLRNAAAGRSPITGILNGLDYTRYNPAFDRNLARNYDSDHIAFRRENKRELQRHCGFDENPVTPLLGMVGRMIAEKGVDLLESIVPVLLKEGAQVALLGGVGDYHYRDVFTNLARQFPRSFSVSFSFSEPDARRIYGGADIILVPSLFEPCGLQQMIAMRYGAIPVVRRTGGLADSVAPWEGNADCGKGVLFDEFTPTAFLDAVQHAIHLYRSDPADWMKVVRHNMAVDLSWDKSAREYLSLYRGAAEDAKVGRAVGSGDPVKAEQSDLLVHSILSSFELAGATDVRNYLKQVSRSARELVNKDAVLIWLMDEHSPERLRLAAASFSRDGRAQNSSEEIEVEQIYTSAGDRMWSWQYVYRLDGVSPGLTSQVGFLKSALAQQHGWASQMTVPMNTQGKIIGRLDVFSCDPAGQFSENDLAVLGALARTVALNVVQQRTFERLLAMDRKLASAPDLDVLARTVLSFARELTRSDGSSLAIEGGHQWTDGDSTQNPRSHLAPDMPRISAEIADADGRVFGRLEAWRAADFSIEERADLARIAAQALQPIHAAQKKLSSDSKRTNQLNRLSASLVTSGNLPSLLQQIVSTTSDVLQVEAASLYLINENTRMLEIRAAEGHHAPLMQHGAQYELGEGSTGWIAKLDKPLKADTLSDLRKQTPFKAKYVHILRGWEPRAFLGIPLAVVDRITHERRVIGVLKLEDRRPDPDNPSGLFTPEDVSLGEMMANIIATVVHNAQLSTSQLQQLSTNLGELSKALAGGQEMRTLVKQVVDTMARVLGAEASSLYLIDERNGKIVIQAAAGYQEPLVKAGAFYELGKGVTGWIAEKGEPFRADTLDQLHKHPAHMGAQNDRQGGKEPNSFLGLPLKVVDRFTEKEKVIGVLKVEDMRRSANHPEAFFTDQDVSLVTMMANVIATVVYNTQISNAQVQTTSRNLEELSISLAGGQEMRVLVKQVVDTMARVLGAEASSLYLIDEMSGKLVIQAATGYQEPLVKAGASYSLGKGVTGWIAEKGEPFRANTLDELHKHPAHMGAQNSSQGGKEPNSFLGLPLKVVDRFSGKEKVIGVLKVEEMRKAANHPEAIFTDQDVSLVTMMANVIATVVYNTQISGAQLQRLSNNLDELSKALTGGQEMASLLARVVNTTARVLGAEASSLYLIDEATGKLVIKAAMGYQEPLVKLGAQYDLGHGVTGYIAKTGKPFRANNLDELHAHVAWRGAQNPGQGGREPRSFLGIPLRIVDASGAQQIIGVLKVEDITPSSNHPDKVFTDQDVLLVSMLANVIATVIHNTRKGEARLGSILQRLGVQSAPINASETLLREYACSNDLGLIDQMAIATAAALDRAPETSGDEAEALFRSNAATELYGRIAAWAKNPEVRWMFLVYDSVLRSARNADTWEQVSRRASPWFKLMWSANDPHRFGEAVSEASTFIARAIGLDLKHSGADANYTWYGTVVDTARIFGDKNKQIPFLFQRQGTLDEHNQMFMLEFAKGGMKRSYNVVVLVPWRFQVTPEEVQAMRKRMSIHAIDVVVAGMFDLLHIIESPQPPDAFRNFVLRQATTQSPFILVGPVPDTMFFGRDRELDTILNYIGGGQSCVLIGGRRIGKTSVLSRLHRVRLADAGFQSIFHDCSDTPTPDEFLRAQISAWRPEPPPDAPADFSALLNSAGRRAQTVLLLDEADDLVEADGRQGWRLFNRFRNQMNSGAIRIVLTGERGLRKGLRDPSSPLFNFANEMLLGPLSFEDVEALITRPFSQLDIQLADDTVVKKIYESTSGHPNVVQRLCSRLINIVNESKVRVVSADHVSRVIEDPAFQSNDFLDVYWQRATALEKLISLLMANDQKLTSMLSIRDELSHRCNLEVRAGEVDEALTRLVELRSILKRTPAGYRFAVPAFPSVVSGGVTSQDKVVVFAEECREELSHGAAV